MSALDARLALRATPRSPRTARHLVDELLTAWAADRYRDDAALIVNELVTNVVEHVGADAHLVVELNLSDAALRLSVADGAAVRPVMQELSDYAPRGRGIRMIATLADQWGCEDHAGGKRIWVKLRPPQDTPEEQYSSDGGARLPPAIGLTAGERDVLEQLASLRNLEEIADHLAVSVNTVRSYLRALYDKLGVSSRRTAVLAARELGLLT